MSHSSVRLARVVAETIESRVLLSAAPHFRVGQAAAPLSNPIPGLTGEYFDGSHLKNETLTRTDPDIDFNWNSQMPDGSATHHAFSVQWTGQITPQHSEVYTFSTVADDGVRLWVGGKLLINNWHDEYPTANHGRIMLEAGQAYDIRLDYYENSDPPAVVQLYWKSASQPKEIVPTSALQTRGPVAAKPPTVGSAPPPVVTGPVAPMGPVAPVVPAAPTGVTATATSFSQTHVSWNDVTSATGYTLERSTDAQTWTMLAKLQPGQTQFDDAGLSPSTTYHYRVIATDAGGASAPSNVADATTHGLVYAFTNSGAADTIDTTTGKSDQVGTLLFGTAAADRDPATGKFYYVEQNTLSPRVAVWDPTTNTNTVLGTISVNGQVMRAAFRADGMMLITANSGDLYAINPKTGVATAAGNIKASIGSAGDMAFGPDGQLYLEDSGTLYSVNPATLAATRIGNDGTAGNVQIAFGSDGLLYGTTSNGDLYTLSLNTGAATLIANTGVSMIGDLAVA